MASTFLYRTNGTASGTTKYTVSCWVKRSGLATTQYLFNNYTDSNNSGSIWFDTSDKLNVVDELSSSTHLDLTTTAVYRDLSGWYNIVVSVDTTEGSSADRCKIYVNGVQETAFDTATYPGSSANLGFQQATAGDSCRIGATFADADFFDGLMTHIHYIDATAYPASTFGSTDATTGEWNINTSPTVTYGDNGYFVLENGAVMTDSSPNSNNFAKNGAGTFTNTEDNPSNVFCALNPLNFASSDNAPTYANANNYVITGGTSGSDWGGSGTFGLKKGVWYFEALVVTSGDDNLRSVFGIGSDPAATAKANQELMYNRYSYCWKAYNGAWWTNTNATPGNGTENTSYLNTYTNGDYIGIYFDLDNSKMIFAKNGVLERSGVSDAITAVGSTDTGFYFPMYTDGHSVWTSSAKLNFGNGVFGATALTGSEDSDWFRDAGAQGKFKYNPTQTIDSGTWDARAICTKNINTYG